MKSTTGNAAQRKPEARLAAQQKKARAVEAGLQARTTRAVKAIAIGSAALGIISLGLFAARKIKKRKSYFS